MFSIAGITESTWGDFTRQIKKIQIYNSTGEAVRLVVVKYNEGNYIKKFHTMHIMTLRNNLIKEWFTGRSPNLLV